VTGLVAAFTLGGSKAATTGSAARAFTPIVLKGVDRDAAAKPGEGVIGGYDAYVAASRSYPADEVPPTLARLAHATFDDIGKADAASPAIQKLGLGGGAWRRYGPNREAIQPGILSFSGATTATASRVTAMLIAPSCLPGNCRMWVGVSGGGVFRTNNALAKNPSWKWLTAGIEQNSVGSLTADPNDPSGNTIYLGTGEANRCSSGCEAGVGVYKTTDGGNTWTKLADSCVSNATYACVTPGQDSFLGRSISGVVIDPTDPSHLFVGSALGVRGLSHTIGNGGTTRFPPNANNVGLYESHDGGATFTEVWNGNGSTFGVIDVELDPMDPATVYASAFDQGVWRRSPALDGSATPYDFHQVFAPRFPGGGTDRSMFATTVKNGKTRLYLVEGTANGGGIRSPLAAEFWRTDNANQPAADLLASEAAHASPPGHAAVFPSYYNGWQLLTSQLRQSPYFATDDVCTGQCWYDEEVYTPAGMPDTVYVLGSFAYGELPCDTKGAGCGNNVSNGRAVIYSTTAGDPDKSHNLRTFTDMTYDAQNEAGATWCALPGISSCLVAPNEIHPDQHAIVVNPNNPTQFFEGSDGGVVRTDGTFADTSATCSTTRVPNPSSGMRACQRLLSRIPNRITHIDFRLASLQFVSLSIDPGSTCDVQGGTQDNGTWSSRSCDRQVWPQIIYGDGGNSGFDATNPTWRFNEFTGGFTDANFSDGDPTQWVIIGAPIDFSGERIGFYWPQIGDPNPAPGTHPIYSGAQHVWRSWAFGAGTPGQVPQDTTPNVADYLANCPELTTFVLPSTCGDFQPMGADLTGTAFGTDRSGGSISWLARDGGDHGTLWAATSAGRIFVTHDADAMDPAAVVWHRIDNATSPTRFPSSIYPDASDPGHAWVAYSGYNASTPSTPGHVFSVTEGAGGQGSGSFTNLDVEDGTTVFPTPDGSGDLPVSDIVHDPATHKLFASTDFGVLWSKDNQIGAWHVMPGMPRFEITHLELQPSDRVATCVGTATCPHMLYAATHSQGIWRKRLAH
jgi:hypothetical protein